MRLLTVRVRDDLDPFVAGIEMTCNGCPRDLACDWIDHHRLRTGDAFDSWYGHQRITQSVRIGIAIRGHCLVVEGFPDPDNQRWNRYKFRWQVFTFCGWRHEPALASASGARSCVDSDFKKNSFIDGFRDGPYEDTLSADRRRYWALNQPVPQRLILGIMSEDVVAIFRGVLCFDPWSRVDRRRQIAGSDGNGELLYVRCAVDIGNLDRDRRFADLIEVRQPRDDSGQRIDRHALRGALRERKTDWILFRIDGIGIVPPSFSGGRDKPLWETCKVWRLVHLGIGDAQVEPLLARTETIVRLDANPKIPGIESFARVGPDDPPSGIELELIWQVDRIRDGVAIHVDGFYVVTPFKAWTDDRARLADEDWQSIRWWVGENLEFPLQDRCATMFIRCENSDRKRSCLLVGGCPVQLASDRVDGDT